MSSTTARRIHFGCHECAPLSWENYDSSPTLRLQKLPILGRFFFRPGAPHFPRHVRVGNIAKGLQVKENEAELVYCSHVLEHLSLTELRQSLRNVYRYLKPGGIFRFVLPDLEELAAQYLQGDDPSACSRFMEETMLGREVRPRGIGSFLRDWLGGARHLWMWDYKGLKAELEKAGFVGIRRVSYGDSGIAAFDDVEALSRWDGCLGMQCRRAS